MRQNVENVRNVTATEVLSRNEIHMSVEYLAHHGVKGQKWGVRRYQNPDGSLTPEGIKRYGIDSGSRFTQNVREAGRRSAKASAKASFKGNLKRSAGYTALGTAIGVAGLGSCSLAMLPAVGIAAGTAFVADMAVHTAAGALFGRHYGRKYARQQDAEIRNKVKNGESFVLEAITSTSTAKSTWYGTSISTATSREKMR